MKTIADIESILFRMLKGNTTLQGLTGGIYLGTDRPIDSKLEDIEINSINLTQKHLPQLGVSNINIYVPDISVTINGVKQQKANRVRLDELSKVVLTLIRGTVVEGLTITPAFQYSFAVPEINQHFTNVRLDWNIQTI